MTYSFRNLMIHNGNASTRSHLTILAIVVILVGACSPSPNKSTVWYDFEVANLNDEQYPDNPDIGFRAEDYKNELLEKGKLTPFDSNSLKGDLLFYSNKGDSLLFESFDFSEFIPTIPNHIKHIEYLSYISCINQEWNRNQVKYNANEFEANNENITRVDVARNCLNAYLWEVILYTIEDGKELPYAHGWFDFPHKLYHKWFKLKNNISFDTYGFALEDWIDPESKEVDPSDLSNFHADLGLDTFYDLSDKMYPKAGAREKKFKEIIYPKSFKTMRDLQNDSTLFATFMPPGFYNKKDPRTTELGRLNGLSYIRAYHTYSKVDSAGLYEIELIFQDSTDRTTRLIFGGLDFYNIPVLDIKDANNGWKNSMGIGNHTFYEDSETHNSIKSSSNPYFGVILDENFKWLDSHKIGIDGPIIHFSDEERTKLNIWLLSFERHALVGHYQIVLK
ncbi:MAG: hypothetical protein JXQ87_15310 [Bacteroidia bacterium]